MILWNVSCTRTTEEQKLSDWIDQIQDDAKLEMLYAETKEEGKQIQGPRRLMAGHELLFLRRHTKFFAAIVQASLQLQP